MTTFKTKAIAMMAASAAVLATGLGSAEARGGFGGHGFGGRGFGHHGGFHRHGGFHHRRFGYRGGFYGGYGYCEMVFNHFRGRFVRVCG